MECKHEKYDLGFLIDKTLAGTTYRTKRYVCVPAKLGRDASGRFTGKNRKAYGYSVKDYTQPVKVSTLVAENVLASNALLAKMVNKGLVVG